MSCEIELKLQQCLRNATSVRVLAEARLETTCPERSFASLWDEFVVAKEAWASRVFARQIHMRSCAQCKANPTSRSQNRTPTGSSINGVGLRESLNSLTSKIAPNAGGLDL